MGTRRSHRSNEPRASSRGLGALVVLVATLLVAIGSASARGPEATPAPASVSASGSVSAPAPPSAPLSAPAASMPPGSFADDRGPSVAIFPPQSIPLRFNHAFHVKEQGLKCTTCHKRATTSDSVQDHLTPVPTTCDMCHGSDHSNPNRVTAGDDPEGKCAFCHVGYEPGDGNKVAPLVIPRANMIFSHKAHAARNIACQQCHGDVQDLKLATRDQLPRMRGCFGCHLHPVAAARGDAKSACITCHIKGGAKSGGAIRTTFASGVMQPPRWMHNAQHTPDFIERHKMVAANDSQFCASCHKEEFCVGCHDGRVRPRNIHPNDYLNMHAVEARLATQRCTSCHRQQSFCLGCHQRLGITMSGPSAVREPGRFHPPKSVWSDPPRGPGHHAFEAMRNLNACVSCHIERDCVTCHGGQGIGAGFNPHSGGFSSTCATQLRRNPRPCYVCHEPGAAVLERCR